jgi:hypothetical protein
MFIWKFAISVEQQVDNTVDATHVTESHNFAVFHMKGSLK